MKFSVIAEFKSQADIDKNTFFQETGVYHNYALATYLVEAETEEDALKAVVDKGTAADSFSVVEYGKCDHFFNQGYSRKEKP